MDELRVSHSNSGVAYRRLTPSKPGRQTAFLLLHGIPGSGLAWASVADHLSNDFDVIVPDLLGFGASDRPSGLHEIHAAGQALALGKLVDELHLDRVIVAGHDFGGPVALALHRQRADLVVGLALLATNAFADTPIPFPLSTVTWPVAGRAFSKLIFSRPSLAMMLRSGVGRPRVRLDTSIYIGDRAQRKAIGTIFYGSLTNLEALYRPVEDELHSLTKPTTVSWGDRDPFFGLEQGERTAAAVHTTLKIYPCAGHFLPEERPTDIAIELAALAARTESTGRNQR